MKRILVSILLLIMLTQLAAALEPQCLVGKDLTCEDFFVGMDGERNINVELTLRNNNPNVIFPESLTAHALSHRRIKADCEFDCVGCEIREGREFKAQCSLPHYKHMLQAGENIELDLGINYDNEDEIFTYKNNGEIVGPISEFYTKEDLQNHEKGLISTIIQLLLVFFIVPNLYFLTSKKMKRIKLSINSLLALSYSVASLYMSLYISATNKATIFYLEKGQTVAKTLEISALFLFVLGVFLAISSTRYDDDNNLGTAAWVLLGLIFLAILYKLMLA